MRDDADAEFEACLGHLRPKDPAIERDALIFRAGRASVRRRMRLWQSAAGLLLVALGVSLALSLRPPPTPVERVVQVVIEKQTAPPPTPTERRMVLPDAIEPRPFTADYLRTRDAVLARGLDALPQTSIASAEPLAEWRDFLPYARFMSQSAGPRPSSAPFPGGQS